VNPLEKFKVDIKKIEERRDDSWVDMSLGGLRKGEVRFYRVSDPLTGQWLFKVCRDEDVQRTTVKAIKCPAGAGFTQLEGRTMLFQKSLMEGFYYDVVSFSYLDDEQRLHRNIVADINEVPKTLKDDFKIVDYVEAAGKKAVGKRLVTLCEEGDEKKMILLFLIERAWPLSTVPPDVGAKKVNLLGMVKSLEKVALEEIYQKAGEQYELTKEDTDRLLNALETEGKIQKSGQFVKTVK